VLAFLAAALAAPSADIPTIQSDRGSLEARSAPSPTPAVPSPAPASPTAQPSTPATPVLESAAPWWERITVTVDDKGTQQSCRYETSDAGAAACDKEMADSIKINGEGASGVLKQVTFERRFSPGGRLDGGQLRPGDTLIGRQVMYLTFDPSGAISSCKVVAMTGDAAPNYGCDEAKKEQFRAQASAAPAARQAFMTVLAYGHVESLA